MYRATDVAEGVLSADALAEERLLIAAFHPLHEGDASDNDAGWSCDYPDGIPLDIKPTFEPRWAYFCGIVWRRIEQAAKAVES